MTWNSGDKVVITNYPEHPLNGKTGIYKYSAPDGESHLVWFESDNTEKYFQTRFITKWHEPLPEMDKDEMIAWLTEQLYNASVDVDALSARCQQLRENYRKDMSSFETVMRDAKESENWCDEGANEVIDKLNDLFEGRYWIEGYERNFTVRVAISTTLYGYEEVTVNAISQEQAEEFVMDDPSAYMDTMDVLRDVLVYGSPDIEVEID
jgi:hypothetical protein